MADFDISAFIDEQQRLAFGDTRPLTQRNAMASLVLRSFDPQHGDIHVGQLLTHATTTARLKHNGKTLPATWAAGAHPWWNTMIKDVPPELDTAGNVTVNGLTSVLATAPVADRPWLSEIMFAGGVYTLNQTKRQMLMAVRDQADDVELDGTNVTRIFVFNNLKRYGNDANYDHDKLVEQVRAARTAFRPLGVGHHHHYW